VKCVECLLALGALPNAKNQDDQTPLHIAVQRYIQISLDLKEERKETEETEDDDTEEFDFVKRICKELLFNGADRSCTGRFNLSLLDP
jgi:hypothetical protein